jgi:hypothetical protein
MENRLCALVAVFFLSSAARIATDDAGDQSLGTLRAELSVQPVFAQLADTTKNPSCG